LDFSGNPLDGSATAKASKAFPELFILNGEALTLTRLLEEISAQDFGKSPRAAEDEDPMEEAHLVQEDGLDAAEDDDIGVNQFICESSRNLEGPYSYRSSYNPWKGPTIIVLTASAQCTRRAVAAMQVLAGCY
jgi:hypothetical protein